MANGERCKHCGYQETDHDLGRAMLENGKECRAFVSTQKHKRGCPVLGCDGDCVSTIASANFALEAVHHRASVLIVLTPRATFLFGD